MSVLIPDFKVYNAVFAGVQYVAFNRVGDHWLAHRFYQSLEKKDVHKEIARLVVNWYRLNERSYCTKYGEEMGKTIPSLKGQDKPSILQFIKYLSCIHYNIELTTITGGTNRPGLVSDQDRADVVTLEHLIQDLEHQYITMLPEYDDAKWCDPVTN